MKENMAHERVVHRLLERQAERYGNRTLLQFKDKKYSFAEFNQHSNKVAAGLQNLGIKKGDKIAIMMPNCPEFLFAVFGLSKIGAVEVPINVAHKGDILSYMLNQSETTLMVLHSQFVDRIENIKDKITKIKQFIIIEPKGKTTKIAEKPAVEWSELVANSGMFEETDVIWSDPICILYTSGTTGLSKGVLMPQNYFIYLGELLTDIVGYKEDDILYNALPLFHGNAQQLSFMAGLTSGAMTVLVKRFSASRFWEDIRKYKCTAFNSLGSIVPILAKAEKKPDDADNPLRIIVSAATPKDMIREFEKRFGITFIEIYGMTEFGLPLVNRRNTPKPGSCGKPNCGIVRLIDENNMTVGPNEVGELIYRPEYDFTMMIEYYKMPDKTMECWRNLWFYSGDYFKYDEDGYYYFVDRKKDALRRRGENISSYEVEKVINAHPAVLESAAIGVKSDMAEDELMVCLTLKENQTLDCVELIKFCNEHMAYFMVPRFIRIMEELPKTATERIQKQKLRDTGVTSDTWDLEESGYILKR